MDARERLSAVVLGSLDEERATGELARCAACSRTNFHRLFRALISETPAAMRRRLLLERAAWQLGRTELPVTEIALDALYGSLEAFTRAFRRAFRISPSLYRRMGATHFWLPATNGIHFGASGSRAKGALEMDLFDRFAGHDSWQTRRLLEQAATLGDDDLDRPLKGSVRLVPWEEPDQSLRQILERLVVWKEVWAAAIAGGEMPKLERKPANCSPAAMLARYEKADADFQSVLREVRDKGGWDDTFVDALCEPPETFTFGGMFAHVMTFSAYRRLTAVAVLRRLGIEDAGFGCPIEYERSIAPRTPVEAE